MKILCCTKTNVTLKCSIPLLFLAGPDKIWTVLVSLFWRLFCAVLQKKCLQPLMCHQMKCLHTSSLQIMAQLLCCVYLQVLLNRTNMCSSHSMSHCVASQSIVLLVTLCVEIKQATCSVSRIEKSHEINYACYIEGISVDVSVWCIFVQDLFGQQCTAGRNMCNMPLLWSIKGQLQHGDISDFFLRVTVTWPHYAISLIG